MSYKKYYEQAVQNIFDYSTKDVTSIIAKEHSVVGLMKIFSCMEQLGLDYQNTKIIALSDFTYTKNPSRWNAGFSYGCIISFDSNNPPFIPLDFRPNCCGVILTEFDSFDMDIVSLQKKYYEIVNSYDDIDKKDFNRRNHFLGVYRNEEENKFYCLIHGSFKFVKQQLYSEHNTELLNKTKSLFCINGEIKYLFADAAIDYYNSYRDFEKKTFKYREIIAKELFPNSKVVFHETHEGFRDINTILLGAYGAFSKFECPIMLAPECDLHLISIDKPIEISDGKTIYCAPHGGGYAISIAEKVQKIGDVLNNEYILTYPNNSQMLTNNVLDMPFYYRTNTVNEWCEKHSFAHIKKTLIPIINLKV